MTTKERNQKLKHYITCLKCGVSGKVCDENCSTQYDAGTMGEIIENLEAISKMLEQDTVSKESYDHEYFLRKELETKVAKLEQQISAFDKAKKEIERHRRKTKGLDPYDLVGDCLDIIDECETENVEVV